MGFHHASLLGTFDGFEMSPFFHQFMGNIVFKSYIPDFATGTIRVEDATHPLLKGLPAAFTIENDEWYFQFGHKADLFQNDAFTTLFLNAIRWASEK